MQEASNKWLQDAYLKLVFENLYLLPYDRSAALFFVAAVRLFLPVV